MKFADYDEARFQKEGFRVVPPAAVRQGAFIARNTVLMPSYVNIGAYVDEGTMVDTWATVGSCAQIGKNVHLPVAWASAACWSRCRLTRPLLKITASLAHAPKWLKGDCRRRFRHLYGRIHWSEHRIYDRETGEIHYGRVPAGLWLFQVICRRRWQIQPSTVRLSLRKLTRKLAAKSALTNCCVPSIKSTYTGSMMLPVCSGSE